MQRLWAILLASVLSFLLIAPPVGNGSSSLPACCRMGGKHHCAMGTASGGVPGIAARCPMQRHPGVFAGATRVALPAVRSTFVATILSQPSAQSQTEALFRISFSRARQKRGPPSLLILA